MTMNEATSSVEVILGTYEEYLLGYRCSLKNESTQQTFATHSHCASIRSICTSGRYLASGGADDRIVIYDLQHRTEKHPLTHHSATVNCLAFTPEHTHLLSGCNNGVLAIVRVGSWQLEKVWEKAHKGSPILDIAVHPSGKLALTLGGNHTLCTWNLVKGRQAYVINLTTKSKDPKSVDRITWAPCGVRFLLSGGRYTEVWSIEKGGVLNTIEHDCKVICALWLENEVFLVGYENGKIATVNSETGEVNVREAHTTRVKCMAQIGDLVVTAASKGDFKIWNDDFKMVSEVNTGCRITSLCAITVEDDGESVSESESETSEVIVAPVQVARGKVTVEHDSDTEEVPKKKKKKKSKN
ncbi:hypothetical protein PPYR_12764 [Photinus pyralis]|uniref:WD repeat-containing protein 55 homolog n=1 Tax=Photinus pyralis TaxID=7054 RepID=A0A1Y1M401_PHOPY|nr:p21-activated protein kinase-interacting protein 1-like [Photinus pyralis]KAB0793144.1 hypothetical protein PPYR_12764 [Photinus pyralis]